jgi:hypothetical protein
VGTGTDTTPSSDWMAERLRTPAGVGERPAEPEAGVPVATHGHGDKHRGRAVESRRQRR